MAKTTLGVSNGTAVAVGVGAAAAAAAAAGAYWLYGTKDAAKHRKVARSWMLKARAEIVDGVEKAVKKAGEIDKETYMDIVEGIVTRYSKMAKATKAEISQMTKDTKDAWQHIVKPTKSTARKSTSAKRVRKPVPRMSR